MMTKIYELIIPGVRRTHRTKPNRTPIMPQEINSNRFGPPQHTFSEAYAQRVLERNPHKIQLKHH